MEHFENIQAPENSLLITNIIQLELAELHGESIDIFIEKHAKDFREVIAIHPELLKNFKEDPNNTLDELGKYLYH